MVESEQRALFGVSEAHQGGTDLTGDGDTADQVLFLWEAPGPAPASLGLPFDNEKLLSMNGSTVLVPVSEPMRGLDLNGDGDAWDMVAHVVRLP
jgi:hypothetical protein